MEALFFLFLLHSVLLYVITRGDILGRDLNGYTNANDAAASSGNLFPHAHEGHENAKDYSNEWVVRILGGTDTANLLAYELGYENLGEVLGFPDTYRMRRSDHSQLRKRYSVHLTRSLAEDMRVLWAEQQFAKIRVKRSVLPDRTSKDKPPVRVKRSDLKMPKKKNQFFNDELWDHQWYLQDTRTRISLPKIDLRVLPVYKMGITGNQVRVVVLDDGIERTHSDLRDNYDPTISYDVNDLDPDPLPRYDNFSSNSHGTRCAGEIAMVANNKKCGVGVAYKSRIGGIRMLDGVVNDRVEGTSLCFNVKKVDVVSASWGPNDDGKTVEGPGKLATEAFEKGINQGRGGKGVIYVWAAGNGGSRGDNCNCDGYTSSVYTLSIGSASEHGEFPWYGEMCASTMATTYSSGAYTDQKIATTDLHDKCTVSHTGTSAAAPLAAGIVALTLEANPNITWRDMQHLVVKTADYEPLADNEGWKQNGAGTRFNLRFGFGLMDAYEMVMAAKNWTKVPEKTICVIPSLVIKDKHLTADKHLIVEFNYTSSQKNESRCVVNYLEHVEVVINIQYPRRGALTIHLTSPRGTSTTVLTPRQRDLSDTGFTNWRFMSVHTWGESPHGVWTIDIIDDTSHTKSMSGKLGNMSLILHGTKDQPHYMKDGPRQYKSQNITEYRTDSKVKSSVKSLADLRIAKGPDLDWNDLVGQVIHSRRTASKALARSLWARELERELEEEEEALLRVHHAFELEDPRYL